MEDTTPPAHLPEFDGRPQTLIKWDRTRTVHYNGDEIWMNTYSCSSCEVVYKFEQISHRFCPWCGTEYRFETDVSV